jgi:hypothetical protein
MQINKSDRNDAVGIARIMQCGWYKEVRVKDLDSHAIKPNWLAVDDFTYMASARSGRLGLFRDWRCGSHGAGHTAWSRNLC